MAAQRLPVILLTGGAGYIGSHTLIELFSTGRYECHVLDNLVNSSTASLTRCETILGRPEGDLVQVPTRATFVPRLLNVDNIFAPSCS
jgi:UDP-glucose 4-epimerase